MNANVPSDLARAEPDIRDMMVVHRIFRREFPLLAEIVPRASDRDARRAGHVARHIDFCLDSLHHHHSAEDDTCGRNCWNAPGRTLSSCTGWKPSTRMWPAAPSRPGD